MLVIVAMSASHFVLEWPSHCEDVKITPHDSNRLGADLFNSSSLTFVAEIIIFFADLWVHTTFSLLASKGYKNNPNLLKIIWAIMIIQQVHFCFGSAPTTETRWIHASILLSEILSSSWLLGKLDGQSTSVAALCPLLRSHVEVVHGVSLACTCAMYSLFILVVIGQSSIRAVLALIRCRESI
ncbi:unnamed protein product [Somion occarium]|uniref:Uncharacterized protein n=1 Tax=Somion occarium TaxID=3059160 RepID=A0ABP1CFF5_9APHY